QRPFNYWFLDEILQNAYFQEQRFGQAATIFSGLAVFVACLGLLGLAAFTAEQRTKEIGVRKVLGASIPNIIMLLSKEFLALVLISNIIAWPIAYYLMSQWLQDFAYHIDLSFLTFIAGGLLALLIALATVSLLAFRAARSNPVDALRYE
ncbi:MAG: FtsX-like permease family protein, partial [Candidatus Latescibacteria bacterium]|nr:FtsX-like permease family protein [Candidatus Latescibacterota bacterium]